MATMTSESPTSGSTSDTGTDAGPTAVQRLRDQADAVVERLQPRIAAVSTYAREEPTKALLISAATGAALMAMVALVVRGSSSSRVSLPSRGRAESLASSTMAAIRGAALDLADRAQAMASDALEAAQQRAADAIDGAQSRAASVLDAAKARASDALDATRKRAGEAYDTTQKRAAEAAADARKRAGSAADDASGTAGDAWKTVRDQAQPLVDKMKPMVDKVRPQLDAAVDYAREDPARAALGAAAAAALVIGLVALVRHSQDD